MTISTISIEGMDAQPVGQDVKTLVAPLTDLLSQNARVYVGFADAVEQFQTAMSEALPPAESALVATPETLKVEIEKILSFEAPEPLSLPPELTDKVGVAKVKDGVEPQMKTVSPHDEDVAGVDATALQALPVVEVTLPAQVVPVRPAEGDVGTVAGVSPIRPMMVTGVRELIAVAESVADQMLVSPGLLDGDGEIRVILKPDVLQGTEIRVVSERGAVTVNFIPSVPEVAMLIERNQPMLVQHLAAHVPNVRLGVSVGRPFRDRGNG